MAVDRSRLPAPGAAHAVRFPAVGAHRLTSGMVLRAGRHPGPPVVHWLLLWPAGTASDPAAQPGLAALTADLLDEGTRTRSSLDLHAAVDRIGGRLGAQVGADATMVSLTTLERHAAEGLALLFEIVTEPRFAAADVDRVRELRRSRVRQMRMVPAAVAERVYLETLYPGHPYGHLGIGTDAALAQLTIDDVRRFHRAQYRLGAATLIATGPFSEAAVGDMAERALGGLPAPETDAPEPDVRPDAGVPGPPPARLVLVDRPGAVQSELRIGHVAAARRTPAYPALQVLNMVLGGQFVSRLNRSLREEKGYTYGVRTAFQYRRAPGPFVMQGSVQADATVETIREVIEEMAAIGGGPAGDAAGARPRAVRPDARIRPEFRDRGAGGAGGGPARAVRSAGRRVRSLRARGDRGRRAGGDRRRRALPPGRPRRRRGRRTRGADRAGA